MSAPMHMRTGRNELETLSALIARINSSLSTAEVLEHAAEVCVTLTRCASALVYLWDAEVERLVVRGASAGLRSCIGEFSLALGEGLTGWTALNRRSGMIVDRALADPRYLHVPELNDDSYQSVLTVPIVDREEQLVGVLTMQATAPHEFTTEDMRLMETVASLVAGAVENARLHERALRSAEVFRRVAELSGQLTSGLQPRQLIQRLALTALDLLDAAAVVVLRFDRRATRLLVETWVGGGSRALLVDALAPHPLWAQLIGSGPISSPVSPDDPLARQLGLSREPRSLFSAPLVVDETPIGLLCCYALDRRLLGPDNLALLGTIANHAAIALEEHRLRAAVDERARVRELFAALRTGERASIGSRLDAEASYVAVVAEVDPGAEVDPSWGELEYGLAQVFPGALADAQGHAFEALVPIRSDRWSSLLEETVGRCLDELGARQELSLAAGFSDAIRPDGDFALGFRQARTAFAIARSSVPPSGVRGFATLGAQRHLWTISQERDPDPLEQAVLVLLRDPRRGDELFRTLELYLANRGNARQTAAALYIHRNTLRQRLRRIADVVGIDPADPRNWFDLELAVRLIRFRGG